MTLLKITGTRKVESNLFALHQGLYPLKTRKPIVGLPRDHNTALIDAKSRPIRDEIIQSTNGLVNLRSELFPR